MEEKVSIIIPVYNVEDWLDECLESVVNQTYNNLEIILVDDGSTDNSGKKCDNWGKRDARIVIVHKSNGGLSSARNAGLDKMSGKYVTFLDSDDFIEPETIEYMLKNMFEKSADIVCCGMNRVVNGKIIESKDVYTEMVYSKEELLDGFYYYQNGLCGSVCDKLFRSQLFNGLRFPEGLNSEDYYVLFSIYLKANKMFYNNKCFYNYRMRENSICTVKELTEHSFDKIKISDIIRRKTEQELPQRLEDAKAYQILSRFYTYSINILIKHTKKQEKEWKSDLKKFEKDMKKNKRLDRKLKLKYIGLLYFTPLYIILEKVYIKI